MTSQPKLRLDPPAVTSIAKALALTEVSVEWLAGDGSDRCYYRVRDHKNKKSYVLMQLSGTDAEALKAGKYDWIRIAEILSTSGVKVPKPVALMKDDGALIIDDYGDTMLESFALNALRNHQSETVSLKYQKCFSVLGRFLTFKPDPNLPWCTRAFDEERFSWELHFFAKKFLQAVLVIQFDAKQQAAFDTDVTSLSKYLAALSKYFVHRDFHSRNVMVVGDDVAIIDFQDARLGPASYDLVSLCFDSYIPFSASDRRELLKEGCGVIAEVLGGLHGQNVTNEILNQWKPVLLQRQLKAIGSFGYLTVDKNKGDYLKNVGPALATLEQQDVFDARWPFLSGELLKLIRREWNHREKL